MFRSKKFNSFKKFSFVFLLTVLSLLLSFSCFAADAWYTPNVSLSALASNPAYDAYWIEVEYYLDGEVHSYNTEGATSASQNVNVVGSIINFGNSNAGDVVQYNGTLWRVRLAGSGDVVTISNTDVKMRLHVIDESAASDFVSWFNDNFTIQSVSNGGILSDFTGILVGGISGIASGIGEGVNTYVQDLFLLDGGGLSVFGGVIAIFGSIALAVGLTTLIFHWLRSIGN